MIGSPDLGTKRDDDRAGHHAQRDKAVDAGAVAVRHHGRAGGTFPGAKSHLRGDLIAEEADDAGGRQY
jgi:hypothetical protein